MYSKKNALYGFQNYADGARTIILARHKWMAAAPPSGPCKAF